MLSTLSTVLGIVVIVAAGIGGLVTFLIRRRGTTGRVNTSDAATLWAQSQQMREQLLAEKTRAEDQRDRVLAIQASQVVPVLASTAESLTQILAALDRLMAAQDQMDAMLTQLRDRYITGGDRGR
jgi:trans-2-enoyl-CoA reductase